MADVNVFDLILAFVAVAIQAYVIGYAVGYGKREQELKQQRRHTNG